MKIHQLQALIAMAEHGSIRAAAKALALSQAAVSKTLRELEAEQQLPLLQRHAGGTRLNDAGRVLLKHARQVLRQLERAEDELAALRGQHAARLCVGVTPWLAETLLPDVVRLFRQRMPEIRLELFEGLLAVALPLLRDGQMDFAIGPLFSSISAQEFHCQPLLTHPCRVFARHGHPALRARSLEELLEQDWVVNYSPVTYEQVMHSLFGRHGLGIGPERLICAHSMTLLSSMVLQAGMLSFGPEPLLLCHGFQPHVQALSLREQMDGQAMGIISHQGHTHSYAAMCFIDCLQQSLKQKSRSSHPTDRALSEMLSLLF
jgi:DNA-binding transcriptional LysR family regulator